MLKWPTYIYEVEAHYASSTFGQTEAGCHEVSQLVFGGWREENILAASSFYCRPRVEDGVIRGSIFCRVFAALRDGPITKVRPEDIFFEGEISVELPRALSKEIISLDSSQPGLWGCGDNSLAATTIRREVAAEAIRKWSRLQNEAGEPLVLASYVNRAELGVAAPTEIRLGLLPRSGVQKTIRALEPRIQAASKRDVFIDGDNLAWQRELLR